MEPIYAEIISRKEGLVLELGVALVGLPSAIAKYREALQSTASNLLRRDFSPPSFVHRCQTGREVALLLGRRGHSIKLLESRWNVACTVDADGNEGAADIRVWMCLKRFHSIV